MKRLVGTANTGRSINASQTDKSFLVLFFKKEQEAFFLKKEAKTFIHFRLGSLARPFVTNT
jgi:hypothetical protein